MQSAHTAGKILANFGPMNLGGFMNDLEILLSFSLHTDHPGIHGLAAAFELQAAGLHALGS